MSKGFPVFEEDQFDPEDVSNETMDAIRESLEAFLDFQESIMIIPPDIEAKYGKDIREGIKQAREEICRRLKKHKRGIFVAE